ncbi:Fc.00g050530.m01.CDS01 [Cosmosporella sp. VM-42]
MSRFFPHTPYAEDQPLSKTILTTHVITRTITMSTIIASGITTTRQLIPYFRPVTTIPFPTRLLFSASTGTLIALGLGAAMTAGRMNGREEIEWQDRAWRLIENPGQVEVDDWTYIGMGAGAAMGAVRGGGWRAVTGGMGLGSVLGMVGYMGWRYGVNGGKFPEVKREEKVVL